MRLHRLNKCFQNNKDFGYQYSVTHYNRFHKGNDRRINDYGIVQDGQLYFETPSYKKRQLKNDFDDGIKTMCKACLKEVRILYCPDLINCDRKVIDDICYKCFDEDKINTKSYSTAMHEEEYESLKRVNKLPGLTASDQVLLLEIEQKTQQRRYMKQQRELLRQKLIEESFEERKILRKIIMEYVGDDTQQL